MWTWLRKKIALFSTFTMKRETSRGARRYLIACDGASSTVRRCLVFLSMTLASMSLGSLLTDCERCRFRKLAGRMLAILRAFTSCTYIIGPGNHRRWEIMLNPGGVPRGMEREENVLNLLSRWLKL